MRFSHHGTRNRLAFYALNMAVLYVALFGATYWGLVLFVPNVIGVAIVGVVGAAWLGWHARQRRLIAATPVDRALVVLLGTALIVALTAVDPRRSLSAVWLLGLCVLMFACCADLLAAGLPGDWLRRALIMAATAIIVIALVQVVDFYRSWIGLLGWRGFSAPVALRIAAPNIVAQFINLVWPLAIVELVGNRTPLLRVALVAWLGAAALALFFSSSRGGWLGAAGGMAVLLLLLGLRHGADRFRARRMRAWGWLVARRSRPLLLAALLVGAAIVGVPSIARQLVHPTHASFALARAEFWPPAWDAFLRAPLVGSGPFTFGTTYLEAHSIPPLGIFNQVHGTPLNVLAEMGLFGAAAVTFAVGSLGLALWRGWQRAPPQRRLLLSGCSAALAAVLLHGLVETIYISPQSNVLLAVVVALALVPEPDGQVGRRPVPRHWWPAALWALLCVTGGWAVWGYAPFHRGVGLAAAQRWSEAAAAMEVAVARDPANAWYTFQAGLVQALAAAEDGDRVRLARAAQLYRRGLQSEPGYALNWANLAAIEWARGEQAAAFAALGEAEARAANFATFSLTVGAWHESLGQVDAARAAYTRALAKCPDVRNTPFWRRSELRAETLAGWQRAGGIACSEYQMVLNDGWLALAAADGAGAAERFRSPSGPIAIQHAAAVGLAAVAARAGERELAHYYLLVIQAVGTPSSRARAEFVYGDLAQAEDDLTEAVERYERGWTAFALQTISGPGHLANEYGWVIHMREGIQPDRLPGLEHARYTDDVLVRLLQLGEWYEELSHPNRARQLYAEVLVADPSNAAASARLAVLDSR